MMCGSCSNENAFKLMHFKHMEKERGGRAFNQDEIDSCMINQVNRFYPLWFRLVQLIIDQSDEYD